MTPAPDRTRSFAPALIVLLVAAGCAHAPKYDYSGEPDPRKMEFVIGPTDVVRITVWKNPELLTEATVRPDGTITMPLVGDLPAAGMTPSQLKDAVASRLAQFIKVETTSVSVAVVAVNSYRFTVTGNFEHPGIFNSKYYVTLLEAIALAGGLNKFANTHRLLLIRRNGAITRRIPVDFDRIASGDHPDENLALLSGDVLSAP